MPRPLIGITGPRHGQRFTRFCLELAVWLAGGRPRRLLPGTAPPPPEKLHGLIIAGGSDVHPLLYGETPKPGYQYDAARDALELAWARHALETPMPVLGICRGAQLLNIALGGNLYMDIRLVDEKARYPGGLIGKAFRRKRIEIAAGSLLARLLGGLRARVNSLHRQSLNRLGAGLVVTAKEKNGIVQAVEQADGTTFLLGVQWHPELMLHSAGQRRIFRALVEAAGRG